MASGIGIDIGTESIKIVRVSVSRGKVSVLGALKVPRGALPPSTPESLAAPGKKPAEPPATLAPLPRGLAKQMGAAQIGTHGTVGVTGREINLRYLVVPPVPREKLNMLLGMELGGRLSGKGQLDDVPPMTYDYRILNLPGGLKSDLTIMAGIAKNDYLMNVHAMLKAAGISAETMTPSCFGLINAYLSTQTPPPGETVVLCDVGHELLEIAILEDRNVYFARSASGGGKRFNLALDKVLQTTPERASIFKHERARIYPEGAEMRTKQDENFQPALREGADAIAAAIRSSITFCRTQAKMPKLDFTRVYLSGGGARVKGLCEYLEKKLGPGRTVQPLNLTSGAYLGNLRPADAKLFEGTIPDMTVALGLAIVDADSKTIHYDFVPDPIKIRRSFWRKTVVAIVAGVILIAGLVPPYLFAQRTAGEAAQTVQTFSDHLADVAKQKKEYAKFVQQKKILALKADYYARQTRMDHVYMELLRVIRGALPPHILLTYVGPPLGGGGGGTSTPPTPAPTAGMNSLKATDDPIREFSVMGSYEKDVYPEKPTPPLMTINEAWIGKKENDGKVLVGMREKLLEVIGVEDASLVALADTDPLLNAALEKQGRRPFQVTIKLQNPAKPFKNLVEARDAAAAKEAGGTK